MEIYSSESFIFYLFDGKIRNHCVKIQPHKRKNASDGSEKYLAAVSLSSEKHLEAAYSYPSPHVAC